MEAYSVGEISRTIKYLCDSEISQSHLNYSNRITNQAGFYIYSPIVEENVLTL